MEAAAEIEPSSVICSVLAANKPHCKALLSTVEGGATANCLSTLLASCSLSFLEGLFQVSASLQLFVLSANLGSQADCFTLNPVPFPYYQVLKVAQSHMIDPLSR